MDLNRSSDETQLIATVKNLQQHLSESRQSLEKWGLSVRVELKTEPLLSVLISVSVGGHAYVKYLSLSDVQYYVGDPETLISEIADDAYRALLKNNIRDEIRDPIKKALINCNRMASR